MSLKWIPKDLILPPVLEHIHYTSTREQGRQLRPLLASLLRIKLDNDDQSYNLDQAYMTNKETKFKVVTVLRTCQVEYEYYFLLHKFQVLLYYMGNSNYVVFSLPFAS